MIDGERFDIDTRFETAIECERIAQDETIGDTERALAIIYKLFGDKGIDENEKWDTLIKAAVQYLSCGKKSDNNHPDAEKPDMDYIEDERYIKTSFLQEYNIDLSKTELHWWDFYDLLNGLTENAVLSRVRYIRDYDVSNLKDSKEKQKILKQKQALALKGHQKEATEAQKASHQAFMDALKK